MYQHAFGISQAHVRPPVIGPSARLMQMQKSKSQTKRQLRQAQRQWLSALIDATGKSLSTLAREAQLSDTTLTRFHNDQSYGGTLSPTTVASLAERHGFPAPEARGTVPAGASAEAVIYEGGEEDAVGDAVRRLISGRADAHPWRIISDVLALAHVKAGDIVVMDRNVAPKPGDVIAVQNESAGRNGRTLFRIFDPPFAVAACLPIGSIKPMLINGEGVRVAATMTELIRLRA